MSVGDGREAVSGEVFIEGFFDARIRNANKVVLAAQLALRSAEAKAHQLQLELPTWRTILADQGSRSVASLGLTPALTRKLQVAGFDTIEKLVKFWLAAGWTKRTSLQGIADASVRKVTLALRGLYGGTGQVRQNLAGLEFYPDEPIIWGLAEGREGGWPWGCIWDNAQEDRVD